MDTGSSGDGVSVCENGRCESSPSLLLLLPVLCSLSWILFQLFYGSWLLAALISRITNFFLKDSGIYIGELVPVSKQAGRQ